MSQDKFAQNFVDNITINEAKELYTILKNYAAKKWVILREPKEFQCTVSNHHTDNEHKSNVFNNDESKDDIKDNYPSNTNKCPNTDRVKYLLEFYSQITNQLSQPDGKYPYDISTFLNCLPLSEEAIAYEPIHLSQDIEHILNHKPASVNYSNCSSQVPCMHYTRIIELNQHLTTTAKKRLFNTDNSYDFPYISMLDAAHCLIYHFNEISTEKIYQQFKQNVQEVMYPIFSTGTFIDYISLKPLYQNLRNEITENKQHTIEIEMFKNELQQAKLELHPESTTAMTLLKASKTDEKYGVYKDEKIHIEHVIAILLYCNYSDLCKTFRESFRKLNCDDT
eukprot:470379_1